MFPRFRLIPQACQNQVHEYSDHHTVSWVFNLGQEELDLESQTGYNFKSADADEWKGDFGERMDSHAGVFTELTNAPRAIRNVDLLERATAAMHDALSGATEATVPKKRSEAKTLRKWRATLQSRLLRLSSLS
ncbi:hypothetical protein AURDEDRAFT_175202 [Auricularia subglabra TFB-10046 SS5]|nr:hypothetical protein AURDEDRAFT_175202 [Auricularia subglabra TFB-10046 SS5]